VHVDGARFGSCLITPNGVKQLITRQHHVRMPDEMHQQLELLCRQPNRTSASQHLSGARARDTAVSARRFSLRATRGRAVKRGRAALVASASLPLFLGGACIEEPLPLGHIVLYIDTDAPLPTAPGFIRSADAPPPPQS